MKSWLLWAAGIIAAIALVLGNVDKILSFGVRWLEPYIIPYVSPHTTIVVALDPNLVLSVAVFVADPEDEKRALVVSHASQEQNAILRVPSRTFYTIGWQGPGLNAGAAQGILATDDELQYRLTQAGNSQEAIELALRQMGPEATELAPTEPNASLLLSAQAAEAANIPSISLSSGALPELDRATAIIGLFETGTTDCSRQVAFIPHIAGGRVPAVGCMGASIPGWLADVLRSLDAAESHRLDVLLGDDDADAIRNFLANRRDVAPEEVLRRAMERLIAAPEFWIRYQERVLASYAQATDAARQVGLVSERGRLLMFDRLVHHGPGALTRVIRRYTEQYPQGADNRPDNEAARIRAVGGMFKAIIPRSLDSISPFIQQRIDTIVDGHGSIRGIRFDLDQLGVTSSE